MIVEQPIFASKHEGGIERGGARAGLFLFYLQKIEVEQFPTGHELLEVAGFIEMRSVEGILLCEGRRGAVRGRLAPRNKAQVEQRGRKRQSRDGLIGRTEVDSESHSGYAQRAFSFHIVHPSFVVVAQFETSHRGFEGGIRRDFGLAAQGFQLGSGEFCPVLLRTEAR